MELTFEELFNWVTEVTDKLDAAAHLNEYVNLD